jgi:hypothetical protein
MVGRSPTASSVDRGDADGSLFGSATSSLVIVAD